MSVKNLVPTVVPSAVVRLPGTRRPGAKVAIPVVRWWEGLEDLQADKGERAAKAAPRDPKPVVKEEEAPRLTTTTGPGRDEAWRQANLVACGAKDYIPPTPKVATSVVIDKAAERAARRERYWKRQQRRRQ